MDWSPRIIRAFEHYGIDYQDFKYKRAGSQLGGWCPACHNHAVSNPFQLCDLEIARAEDIREHGFEARHCAHCRKAYPTILDRACLCPSCQRKEDERNERFRRELAEESLGLKGLDSGVRVPDGAGCTEKIPAWMVDWDGNPGNGGPT